MKTTLLNSWKVSQSCTIDGNFVKMKIPSDGNMFADILNSPPTEYSFMVKTISTD